MSWLSGSISDPQRLLACHSLTNDALHLRERATLPWLWRAFETELLHADAQRIASDE